MGNADIKHVSAGRLVLGATRADVIVLTVAIVAEYAAGRHQGQNRNDAYSGNQAGCSNYSNGESLSRASADAARLCRWLTGCFHDISLLSLT